MEKVPRELQQEVKEITDSSVQELLLKLLKAELTIAEKKCCSQETTVEKPPGGRYYGPPTKRSSDGTKKPDEGKGVNSKDSTRERVIQTVRHTLQSEASMEYVKCCKYKVEGPMAKNCPELMKKSRANVIVLAYPRS